MERLKPNDGEGKIYSALELLYHDEQIDGVIRISGQIATKMPHIWGKLSGIDFLVVRGSYGMPIESKSSKRGAKAHRHKGRTAPTIIAGIESKEDLANRLLHLMDEGENHWNSRDHNLFHAMLDLSVSRPDLFREYSPLFRTKPTS